MESAHIHAVPQQLRCPHEQRHIADTPKAQRQAAALDLASLRRGQLGAGVSVRARGDLARAYGVWMTDEQRERLIDTYVQVVTLESKREIQLAAAARIAELVRERSPEQIAKMETERGLR